MKNKKRLAILLSCLAIVLAMSLSLAYFTDRTTGAASMKAVDNAIDIDISKPDPENPEPDPDNPTDPDDPTDPKDPSKPWKDPTPDDDTDDLTNWWAALNAEALANFNPGDKISLDGTITNSGTLDLDYRQTYVLTCNKAMNTTTPEFRLFSNCTKDKYGAKTGIDVLVNEKIAADGKKITYNIAPAKLVVGASTTPNVDLVFDKMASNAFQGAKITVDYLIEARQANAAGANADWTPVATGTVTIGGSSVAAVPKAADKTK